MVIACLAMAARLQTAPVRFVTLGPEPKGTIASHPWDQFAGEGAGAISPDGSTVVVYFQRQGAELFSPEFWRPKMGPKLTQVCAPGVPIRAVANNGAVIGSEMPIQLVSAANLILPGALYQPGAAKPAHLSPAPPPESVTIEKDKQGHPMFLFDLAAISADGSKVFGTVDAIKDPWIPVPSRYSGVLSVLTEWDNLKPRLLASWGSQLSCFGGTQDGRLLFGENPKGPLLFTGGRIRSLEEGGSPMSYRVEHASDDGSIVFGRFYRLVGGTHSYVDGALFWRNGRLSAMAPKSAQGATNITITGVSGSGALAVGGIVGSGWDEFDGALVYDGTILRPLDEFLANDWGLKKEIAGWKLKCATGISKDGNEIVGDAISPDGVPCVFAAFRR